MTDIYWRIVRRTCSDGASSELCEMTRRTMSMRLNTIAIRVEIYHARIVVKCLARSGKF